MRNFGIKNTNKITKIEIIKIWTIINNFVDFMVISLKYIFKYGIFGINAIAKKYIAPKERIIKDEK